MHRRKSSPVFLLFFLYFFQQRLRMDRFRTRIPTRIYLLEPAFRDHHAYRMNIFEDSSIGMSQSI